MWFATKIDRLCCYEGTSYSASKTYRKSSSPNSPACSGTISETSSAARTASSAKTLVVRVGSDQGTEGV
jgi:hypothetical protein